MVNGEQLLAECRMLSDARLLEELKRMARDERVDVVKVLARLAILNGRELSKEIGYPSLFLYCVRELGYCEGTAFYRSKAAQACARFPILLGMLSAGDIHLSAVALLCDHLTPENHKALVQRARGLSKRQLERLLAELRPQEKPPESTRPIAVIVSEPLAVGLQGAESLGNAPSGQPGHIVPGREPGHPGVDTSAACAEMGADASASCGEGNDPRQTVWRESRIVLRTEHRFTVSDATEAKLVRAQELLSHKLGTRDVEPIFDAALDALLEKIDPDKIGARARGDAPPRLIQTRRVPNWVKRRVRERDKDQCAFVSPAGVRCGERMFLQFDHITPWSQGGGSDDPENIRQVCASHNQWRGRQLLLLDRDWPPESS